MDTYSTLLALHSWLRWLVIAAGFWAIAVAASRAAASPLKNRGGLVFTTLLDVQFLVGLTLYLGFSPITQAAMADMAGAMKNSLWRFWAVEHPFLMFAALALAHIARFVEKSGRPRAGRRAIVWYALAVAALLLASPWPFMPQGRPWFRGF
jgi:hypothetical protein